MSKQIEIKETRIKGNPVSAGIAIGELYLMPSIEDEIIPEFSIASTEVDHEIHRYRSAISSSRKDLHELQGFLSREGSSEAVTIIDTHIQMLEDPLITTQIEDKIRHRLKNTEFVFRSVIVDYESQFSKTENEFFKQRLLDVKDLSQRIMRHLHPKETPSIHEVPQKSIVFAKELIPSDTAEVSQGQVIAFVTEVGGGTTHAALIARAKGIPYVSDISTSDLLQAHGERMIVDGKNGIVIINPTEETVQEYENRKKEHEREYFSFVKNSSLCAITRDGHQVEVLANIDCIDDLKNVHITNADGVGLTRTEFLFSGKDIEQVDEEIQFQVYKRTLEKAKDLTVVFRVFDLGGDKRIKSQTVPRGENPAFAVRSIRFLLERKDLFIVQLRALLRASVYGHAHILLPFVIDVQDVVHTKELIKDVMNSLKNEGLSFSGDIALGSMIETPSAALTCDLILDEVDFLSVGTNDLYQYTIATNRTTPKPIHLSLIRMIKSLVIESKRKGKAVAICGEIASSPIFTELLLGLGVRQLSCSPRFIPILKETIRKITISDAVTFAGQILTYKISGDIYIALEKRLEEHLS